MATATKKPRAATGANRGAVVASESVSMEFLIVEDNGGDYHWDDRSATRNAWRVIPGCRAAGPGGEDQPPAPAVIAVIGEARAVAHARLDVDHLADEGGRLTARGSPGR